jgi:hypothetical protein
LFETENEKRNLDRILE